MNALKKTKEIMSLYNIQANKRFGQNFLVDDNILSSIVDVSDISKNDIVIEIGPGLGNLTEYLLDKARFVILIEIDNKMINILESRFTHCSNYTILNEDILKVDIDELVENVEKSNNLSELNVKVVANLPYYITTPILFKLLQDSNRIQNITVMVQKEVAQRMVALPKSKDYGILTLMVKYLANASIKFFVPSCSFIPAPNVESAIVKLDKQKIYEVKDESILYELIHKAFAQRRKKMVNSLENNNFLNMNKAQIEDVIIKCGMSPNVRAEEVSIEKYIEIADNICK